MTETEIIAKKIRPFLESLGVLVIKYHGSLYSQAGVSDLLCVLPPVGKFVALEIKKRGNKPTQMQLLFLEKVKNHGGIAGVVYTDTYKEDINRLFYEKNA
jgi:hypothetical protein